jgi:hypothetical protein
MIMLSSSSIKTLFIPGLKILLPSTIMLISGFGNLPVEAFRLALSLYFAGSSITITPVLLGTKASKRFLKHALQPEARFTTCG